MPIVPTTPALPALWRTARVGVVCLLPAVAAAQPGNTRDTPYPLRNGQVSGMIGRGEASEVFYRLAAGPGELTLTADVTSTTASTGVTALLYDGDWRELLRAGADGSGRRVERTRVARAQTLYLAVRRSQNTGQAAGRYLVRVDGPAARVAAAAPAEGAPATDAPTRGAATLILLPTAGTLRLRMRDGSTRDVDLRGVREARVLAP
jgi:hypothetical protein